MKKLVCVVATIGVLMSLTAIPVSANYGYTGKVETKYQGSKLCNQAVSESTWTDQSSQNFSVALSDGNINHWKANVNFTVKKNNPKTVRSGMLETSYGYDCWSISSFWRN